MIAPYRLPHADSASLLQARRTVSQLTLGDAPLAPPMVRPWRARLVAAWMLFVLACYALRMLAWPAGQFSLLR
jgi:hypothetical protein